MKNTEKLKELAKEYELNGSDFFKSPLGFIIITRGGIEKIAKKAEISLSYEIAIHTENQTAVKCTAEKNGRMIQSFGEVDFTNLPLKKTKSDKVLPRYPLAMAEKRAKSRAVLMFTDFYALDVYGEDESPDFENKNK